MLGRLKWNGMERQGVRRQRYEKKWCKGDRGWRMGTKVMEDGKVDKGWRMVDEVTKVVGNRMRNME